MGPKDVQRPLDKKVKGGKRNRACALASMPGSREAGWAPSGCSWAPSDHPAEGEGPSGTPTPSMVLPRAADSRPLDGAQASSGPEHPSCSPGAPALPLVGVGAVFPAPPLYQGRRVPPSETLLHPRGPAHLHPQALLPEARAGPSEHSLPTPGPSVHPCLPAHLGGQGAQSPVPSPTTPLPQHGAQPEGRGMPSPRPF